MGSIDDRYLMILDFFILPCTNKMSICGNVYN